MYTAVRKVPFRKFMRKSPKTVEYEKRIAELVVKCNRLHIHATHFVKYYLLNCPPENQQQLTEKVLVIILCLLNTSAVESLIQKTSTESRWETICHLKPFMYEYKKMTAYQGENLKYFHQVAAYMATLLHTNLTVNIKEHFVRKIRKLITELVIKQSPKGCEEAKRQAVKIREVLFGESNEVGSIDNPDDRKLLEDIHALLPTGIHSNGICYDLACRPEVYVHSYILLQRLYQRHGLRKFQAVPLATSTVPRHVTIDTKILCQHVLGMPTPGPINDKTKHEHWSKLFNIQNRLFRGGDNARLKFSGMIRTDLVSLCIIFKDSTTRCKRGHKPKGMAKGETC